MTTNTYERKGAHSGGLPTPPPAEHLESLTQLVILLTVAIMADAAYASITTAVGQAPEDTQPALFPFPAAGGAR